MNAPHLGNGQSTEAHDAPPTASVAETLGKGVLGLGASSFVERGIGFLANVAAARLGGPQLFGLYSIVLSTASTVASYSSAGIATTCLRFGGTAAPSTAGFSRLVRSLATVAAATSVLAAGVMIAAAEPLANLLLRRPDAASLVRLAGLSAAGIILLESLKGFLVGQGLYKMLLVLAVAAGGVLLVGLPAAGFLGSATLMVLSHGVSALIALAVVLIMATRLRLKPASSLHLEDRGPSVREVLAFGLAQLAGVAGLNLATWWLAALVARCDPRMAEMGFYAVAGQLRNLVAITPGLVSQVSYPMLTEERAGEFGGAGLVLDRATVATAMVTIAVAAVAVAVLPWVLPLVYGRRYSAAEPAAGVALMTAVVHMTNAPAALRLTIVNLRQSTIINVAWAVVVIALGQAAVGPLGATGAFLALFVAHTLAALAVLACLRLPAQLPRATFGANLLAVATGALVSFLWVAGRDHWAAHGVRIVAMTLAIVSLAWYANRRGWLRSLLLRLRRRKEGGHTTC